MKKRLILLCLCASCAIFAGECKYCGVDTKNCTVYRCNKCRKFFCEHCREGDGKKETKNIAAQQTEQLITALEALSGKAMSIVCPECGNKDRMIYGRMQDGKIRIIKNRDER